MPFFFPALSSFLCLLRSFALKVCLWAPLLCCGKGDASPVHEQQRIMLHWNLP